MKRKWLGTKLAVATCLFAAQAAFLAPAAGAGDYDGYCEDGDYAKTVSAYDSPDYQQVHDTRTHDYVDAKVTINGTYMKVEGEDEYLHDADWCILTYQGPEYGNGLYGYTTTYNHYGYLELIKEVTIYSVTTYDPYHDDHHDGGKGKGKGHGDGGKGDKGRDPHKAHEYGKKAEEYGAKAHEYGKKATEYGAKAHEYGQHAAEYGKQADYYNKKAHEYGNYNHHYGQKAMEYGEKARYYGEESKAYGKYADEYGRQSREYGKMADEYGKKADGYRH